MIKEEMDNESESNQTWKKIERDAIKAGYREGVSDGKESKFQTSFNNGYEIGFRNGYRIGQFKGSLLAKQKLLNKEPISNPLLEKIGRGWCQICPTKDTSDLNIDTSINCQEQVSNKYIHQLNNAYPNTLKDSLPKPYNLNL